MNNIYLFIKAIHIISFTAWMAGMFYLPRIFVYHSEKKLDINTYKKFLIMEKKLIKIIMTPAMLATWLLGFALILINNNIELWVLIKIFFVILMSACHGFFIKCYKDFYNKKNKYNDKFFRIINEVPTFLLVVIVFLVVFKPSF
ncbi:MAG: membrane protein [Alphaproteobacteria bacterium]|nr:MAG: membrane protein [Alphaproteobacteria bacterium]